MKRAAITAVLLAVFAASPCLAEEIVYFDNGQALRVEKTRREGKWLFMELSSEGELGVLLRQIKKVEEVQEEPPGSKRSGSVAANVVSASGAGNSRGRGRAPVAAAYESTRRGQAQNAPPSTAQPGQQVQPAPAVPRGRNLVPTTSIRRQPGNRSPRR
ncbi:MAG: hypothetical protein V3U98_11775 [Acidobacteriota bacterium]